MFFSFHEYPATAAAENHEKPDKDVEPMTQRNGRCGKVRQVKMRTRARDREVIRGRKLSTWDAEEC